MDNNDIPQNTLDLTNTFDLGNALDSGNVSDTLDSEETPETYEAGVNGGVITALGLLTLAFLALIIYLVNHFE